MSEGSSLVLAQGTAIQGPETAGTAVAAQARAMIEARYTVALHNPRDWDDVRTRMLKACKRKGFAERARYTLTWIKDKNNKPLVGPSIRFAEEAARSMRNLDVQARVLYDDRDKRIVRVEITDLESVVTYSNDVTIPKVSEKRKLRPEQQAIGSRVNADGEMVYIVESTEHDLLAKQNALVSKAMRNSILRVLPSDILEDALEEVARTMKAADQADPDAARKRIADGFATLNVMPSDLKKYLGHDLSQCSPAQIEELRGVFSALKDGESTWAEIMRAKASESAETDEGAAPKTRAQSAKDAVRQRAKPASEPPPSNDDAMDPPPPEDD